MDDSQKFDRLFRRGTDLLHRGQPNEAAKFLERAYRLNAEHQDMVVNLAGAYILIGRFKQAVPLLESLVERVPDNAMIWTNLGAAYLGNPILAADEEQRKAIAAFKQALEINPAAPHVAYNLGLIYRDRQESEQAIYWFRKAIQNNPNDQDARRILERLVTASDGKSE
jgi:protein O-GlcNAc transferase